MHGCGRLMCFACQILGVLDTVWIAVQAAKEKLVLQDKDIRDEILAQRKRLQKECFRADV